MRVKEKEESIHNSFHFNYACLAPKINILDNLYYMIYWNQKEQSFYSAIEREDYVNDHNLER